MAKRTIKAGATDQTVDIFVMNSSSTTGAGLTGLAYNTASLVCYYRKNATGSATALTLATQTVGGAHSDGGFVEIDATNMPGMYRLDLSDTIVATGPYVTVMLKGATNMAPVVLELELVAYNPFDGVRMGMTALPNAAADAAGGLPISDAGGLDMDSIKTDTAAILVDTGTTLDARIPAALVSGRMDVSVGAMAANVMTAAAAAADLTTELQSGLATAANLATVAGYLDTEIGQIITDVAAVKSDTAAILVDTGTDIPASLTTIDDFLDTEIAAIKAKTDNLPSDPADASDIATAFGTVNSTIATIAGYVDTEVASVLAAVDTEVAAIKAKTDLIPGTIDGKTFAELVTLMAAVLLGKASGLETTSAVYRAVDDSKARVTATVDADGNRSAVTLDAA